MTVFLPILIMTLGVASSVLLLASSYGLPDLLHLTYHAAALCKGVFVLCIAYSNVIKLAFLWSGAALLATGFFYGIIKAAASRVKTGRAIKKLPPSARRGSVVLIRDAESRAAFTHGLISPMIYMSTGLLASLDRDEIKAVFLHELHHKRSLDPLRFFILTLFKDMFFTYRSLNISSVTSASRRSRRLTTPPGLLKMKRSPLPELS